MKRRKIKRKRGRGEEEEEKEEEGQEIDELATKTITTMIIHSSRSLLTLLLKRARGLIAMAATKIRQQQQCQVHPSH